MTTLVAYLDRTADLSLVIGPLPGIATYLGIDKDDVKLRAWYAEAIDWCHEKLNQRDFTADPPDACVMAVYEFVRVLSDYNARSNVLARKIKTGGREEEYPEAGTAGRITAAGMAAWSRLEPYVLDPTLFCSGGGW